MTTEPTDVLTWLEMDNGTTGRTLTTSEAAEALGITASAVTKAVEAGRLRPVRKLPGRTGTYLFRRCDVERLAAKRGAA